MFKYDIPIASIAPKTSSIKAGRLLLIISSDIVANYINVIFLRMCFMSVHNEF